jgi:hypothetical protein
MNGFRDNAQAINTNQADAAFGFGMVAVAETNHRDLHRALIMSPRCSGKRRRLSKRPYSSPAVPVRPVAGLGGLGGMPTGSTPRPLWPGQTGGPAATLWATLVVQRALSS